jgi:hypothetical protein
MTLAEAMAMAVLKGDLTAAYALADKLLEQRANPANLVEEAARLRHEQPFSLLDGYAVYHWPEFKAFAKRMGFLYDLATVDVTIRLKEGEAVIIQHTYAGHDTTGGQ